MTRCSSTIRTTISLTSSKTHENKGLFGVLTMFESSVSHVSHDVFALQIDSKESMRSGNRCYTEKWKKEKVLWSVLHNRCQGKVNGTELVWVWRVTQNPTLKSLINFYCDGWDLQEHLQQRARQAIDKRKIQIREDYIWMSTTWSAKILSEEIQNTHWLSLSVSLNLKDYNCSRIFIGQIKLSERGYLRSDLEMEDHLHQESYARSCREIENLKIRCYEEGNYKNNEDWKNFLRSNDQESRTVSLFYYDPDLLSSSWQTYVLHQALITSSSRKPSREIEMPRNTRENMSILGHVFDRQHAQRDPEELHNYPRNLATP